MRHLVKTMIEEREESSLFTIAAEDSDGRGDWSEMAENDLIDSITRVASRSFVMFA